jgi:hypothetical protein
VAALRAHSRAVAAPQRREGDDDAGVASAAFELKWLFFLDLSMVDRRLHDDLRKIYLRLRAPRFDLHQLHATEEL